MEDFEDFLIWRGAFRFQCGLIAVGCGVVGVGLLDFRVIVFGWGFWGGGGGGGGGGLVVKGWEGLLVDWLVWCI